MNAPHARRLPGLCLGFLVLVATALAPAASAQSTDFSREEFLARSIARLAIFDTRLPEKATETDYRIATIMLGFAQDLRPEDQEILRLRIEAAWSAGDADTVLDLTRRLLALDPADTVAQLRLISARVSKMQTAEARLAAYDRLLSDEGRALDASVRSRLALDAALLLRERGDMDGFASRLAQAVKLDLSHKEAASLAAAFASERADLAGRLELMSNLLMADPIDPHVHLSIAREMAAAGAYAGARRFLRNAHLVHRATGDRTDLVDRQSFALDWLEKGPHYVVQKINRDRMDKIEAVTAQIRALVTAGLPTDQVEQPQDIRVSPQYALIQAAALDAQGERESCEKAVADMALTVSALTGAIAHPRLRAPDATDRQLAEQRRGLSLQLQLARLWVGVQVDEAAAALAPESELAVSGDELVPVLNGMLLMRKGDPEAAIAALRPLAESQAVAILGEGLAHEQAGRPGDAIEAYRRLTDRVPLSTVGAWAATRIAKLGATPDEARRLALQQFGKDIPSWIDNLILQPRDYVSVNVRLERAALDSLDRSLARVTVRNLAPIPLAVGADRPINSRLLFAPKFGIEGTGFDALLLPEVVDIDRRLRLMPRESYEVTIWPDRCQSGLLMELIAFKSQRVRWRVIQGFILDAAAGYRPGPLCIATETDSQTRAQMPESSLQIPEFHIKITTDPEYLLHRLAGAVRILLLGRQLTTTDTLGVERPADDSLMAPLGASWAQRWPSLTPPTRAMLLAVLPNRSLAPSMTPVDDAARADTDPLVQCLFLTTRVTDPADAALAAAAQSADPRVSRIAALVAERLGAGSRCYAKLKLEDLKKSPIEAKEAADPFASGAGR